LTGLRMISENLNILRLQMAAIDRHAQIMIGI
jgi:hypothetical protein